VSVYIVVLVSPKFVPWNYLALSSMPYKMLPEPGFLVYLVRTMSVSSSDQFGMVRHISVPLNLKSTKNKQYLASSYISSHQDIKMSRSRVKTKK